MSQLTLAKDTGRDAITRVVIVAIVLTGLIVSLYPMYFVIIASFSDPVFVGTGRVFLFPRGLNTIGYQRILEDGRIWIGYRNTVIYTIAGTAISLFVTLTAGFALSRRELPGRRYFMIFFVFTMFFNGGLIPTYFLIRSVGMLDTFWVMIIPYALNVFNLVICRTYFQTSIPEELFDASRIDGCSYTRFFLSVVIPTSRAIIAVLSLYYAVGIWNNYLVPLIYIRSREITPLQPILREILISNMAQEISNENADAKQRIADVMKYALIVVSTLPFMILYPFLQKYFEKGVMIGSIKG